MTITMPTSPFHLPSGHHRLSPVLATPRTPMNAPREFFKGFFTPKAESRNPFDNLNSEKMTTSEYTVRPEEPLDEVSHQDDYFSGPPSQSSSNHSEFGPMSGPAAKPVRPKFFRRFVSTPGISKTKNADSIVGNKMLSGTSPSWAQTSGSATHLAGEAFRIPTPPLPLDIPEGDDAWPARSSGLRDSDSPKSFINRSPAAENDSPPRAETATPASGNSDRFQARMKSDSDANCATKKFEWDIPEHLPNSPLCPLHPSYAGGAKGICIYHGRKKTLNEPNAP